jgi:predicted GTPase
MLRSWGSGRSGEFVISEFSRSQSAAICNLFVRKVPERTQFPAISRRFNSAPLQHFSAMDAQQILPRVPRKVTFRVLIIGRANAGKTTILQRVCDTTESPEIYRRAPSGTRERVRPRS